MRAQRPLWATVALLSAISSDGRALSRIPAFARQYQTSCVMCHTAVPKLNPLGEAFRLNGYQLPDNRSLVRRDTGIALGDDAWRDAWPRAIWPGQIPSFPPISLRVEFKATAQRAATEPASTSFAFPEDVYLLYGSSLGDGVSAFVGTVWTRERGLQLTQAKIVLADPIRAFSHGKLNVSIGQQFLYPFTFADPRIDRATVTVFDWQKYRVSDLTARDRATGATHASQVAFRLRGSQPMIELSGLATPRLAWAIGVSQGAGVGEDDQNQAKDLLARLRYKIGGLRLDGAYDTGGGPGTAGHGQLQERRAVILETFAYLGNEPTAQPGVGDRHITVGVASRLLQGPLDLGAGVVWHRDDDPWGVGTPADMRSVFVKAEWQVQPWLFGFVKGERFRAGSAMSRGPRVDADKARSRVMPGITALLRPNVRAALEGELFTRESESAASGLARPHRLVARLDFAF